MIFNFYFYIIMLNNEIIEYINNKYEFGNTNDRIITCSVLNDIYSYCNNNCIETTHLRNNIPRYLTENYAITKKVSAGSQYYTNMRYKSLNEKAKSIDK